MLRPNILVFSYSTYCVIGYREKGNIDTPIELAIRNGTDRFSLAIAAIDHMPQLHNRGAAAREHLTNERLAAKNEAFETGVDPDFLTNWKWEARRGREGGDKGLLETAKEGIEKLAVKQ
jgi:phosphoketolase